MSSECITDCKPKGGQWCGVIGNNCGSTFTCPACEGDWTCKEGLCVGGPSCTPKKCDDGDNRYCGTIGDGCGGTLKCGDCPDGGTCGGGGIESLCTVPNCKPFTCEDPESKGRYCGDIGDGCGGLLKCGDCPEGKACGGDGTPGVCPGAVRCERLQCVVAQDDCPEDSKTTLTGTVYDPAGKLPLYNALVYIPNDPLPLPAIPDGIKCEKCAAAAAGSPLAAALTKVDGTFTLEGVPSGTDVPLVIQVGKWRREVKLDTTINKCAMNALTNKELTRLPKNKSEGHIPRIAVTTGERDALECLLRRIGVEDKEFTTDAGDGRIHLYAGGSATASVPTMGMGMGTRVTRAGSGTDRFAAPLGNAVFPPASSLWSSQDKMKQYDIVVLSCEGGERAAEKQPHLANMLAYMNGGGRVFADHLHFYWIRSGGADLRATADWLGDRGDLTTPTLAKIETSFPKGAALADWLVLTGASTMRGEIPIYDGQYAVASVNPPTQSWIFKDDATENTTRVDPAVQYLSFDTPVTAPAENQCGRVVYTDIHIASLVNPAGQPPLGGDTSAPTTMDMGDAVGSPGTPFPSGCSANDMSPQAKALEFLFFDLSSCVDVNVPPPVIAPPATPPPPVSAPPPPPPPPRPPL